ncbi:thiamine diphosphokinase [Aquicella lusitana]|uniref:Thiamine diphosphokinase n=1 Tax=Aquicella lusitana TaxID=254246 RepID=A0A370GXA4_9COXI|nr:thiamine diphosphokinase [Aquicella lusitana]RDI48109.1 thiamine pyrophosphokinase [Aquicella lusitana]VVC72875.1 hypothetical protein AQULUS_05990 [Aquicella lusitana]
MKNYLLVANGNFLVREIITEAAMNSVIVALDGAADRLIRLGIQPDLILGDFDSIDSQSLASRQHSVVLANDQSLTDLVKAIRYCDDQQAASITLVCATGGRLDHHEGAIRSLRTEYKNKRPLLLHTEQQTLRYARDECITLYGMPGDKCGIMAFPRGIFSSQGLSYDVTDYPLHFGYSESICNSLMSDRAFLDIRGEALLIMPPMLASQRSFMQKSQIERLEMQLRDVKMCETNLRIIND